jgi:Galactose-3-O-sulfotransferase
MQNELTVLFLHLPRAGGSTLTGVLLRQYPPNSVFLIQSRRVLETMDRYSALPEEDRKRYRLIRGHMVFGLHEAVPGPSTYITFLRNPVERVISQYQLGIVRGEQPAYESREKQVEHLVEHCETRLYMLNRQTRLLGGDRSVTMGHLNDPVLFAGANDGWLQAAITHLAEYFVVFGLTERFDESLVLMQRALKWGSVYYRKQNVSARRLRRADLPPATVARIEQDNALDMALYEYASAHFDQQFVAAGLAPAGASRRDLKRFERWNAVYGIAASAALAPLALLRRAKRAARKFVPGGMPRRRAG